MKIAQLPFEEQYDPKVGGVYAATHNLNQRFLAMGHELTSDLTAADIIHCHAVVDASKLPRVDVYTNHGYYDRSEALDATAVRFNAVMLDAIVRAEVVTTPSYWNISRFAWTGCDPIVIHNGVNLDDFIGPVTASLAGRLSRRKPIVLWPKLISNQVCDPQPAFALAETFPDVLFLMISVPASSRSLPFNMIHIGPQPFDVMKDILKISDVHLATTKDVFSVQVLEAMAAGSIILGYNHGGTSEICQDGVNALIAEPGDVDGLAARLRDYLANPDAYLTLKSNAFKTASSMTWDIVADQFLKLYSNLLVNRNTIRPPVSVIIPLYNKADTVIRAVESALAQTVPAEVVVVDDCSTDGSYAKVVALSSQCKIKIHRHAKNLGVAAARNTAIGLASSDYVICLDADDWIDSDMAAKLLPVMERDSRLGIVYTDYLIHSGESTRHSRSRPFDRAELFKGNYIPTCHLLRRKAWLRTKGFKDIRPSWEDWEHMISVFEIGFNGAYVPGIAPFHYTVSNTGLTGLAMSKVDYLRSVVHSYHPDLYRPEVSIIIPCFKQEQWLSEAVDSVLNQTVQDFEVIIIDDGSGGCRTALGSRLADPRIKLIEQENQGLAVARNVGLDAMHGHYVTFLDASDRIAPEFLRETISIMTDNDNSVFVYSDVNMFDDPTGKPDKVTSVPEFDPSTLMKNPLTIVTNLYPAEAFKDVRFDPELSRLGGFEDWDMMLALLTKHNVCGVHLDKPLMHYRIHEDSMRLKLLSSRTEAHKYVTDKYASFAENGRFLEMCCGGRRRAPSNPAPRIAGNVNGFVRMRYTGASAATITFSGPSGRSYRVSRRRASIMAASEDVAYLQTAQFETVK